MSTRHTSCFLQHPSTCRQRQRGNGMSEFLVAALPVLLLGLALIEAANWLYIKQFTSLALLEAGRAGITAQASPDAIDLAFKRALEPLYPPRQGQTSHERLAASLQKQAAQNAVRPWQIRIRQPNRTAFDDFSRPGLQLANMPRLRLIENAYQAEQDAAWRARGRKDGKGPRSGQTIYEANILVLELDYLHRPLLPGLASMLKLLASNSTGYRRQALAAGYLPIRQSIQLGMQSSPADWPSSSHRRVVNAEFENLPVTSLTTNCIGAWCLDPPIQTPYPEPATATTGLETTLTPRFWQDLQGGTTKGLSDSATGTETAENIPALSNNDALCGISLCCSS